MSNDIYRFRGYGCIHGRHENPQERAERRKHEDLREAEDKLEQEAEVDVLSLLRHLGMDDPDSAEFSAAMKLATHGRFRARKVGEDKHCLVDEVAPIMRRRHLAAKAEAEDWHEKKGILSENLARAAQLARDFQEMEAGAVWNSVYEEAYAYGKNPNDTWTRILSAEPVDSLRFQQAVRLLTSGRFNGSTPEECIAAFDVIHARLQRTTDESEKQALGKAIEALKSQVPYSLKEKFRRKDCPADVKAQIREEFRKRGLLPEEEGDGR